MGNYKKALEKLLSGKELRFEEAKLICEKNFGKGTQRGSHLKFKVPDESVRIINIQNKDGKLAAYQARQLLEALGRIDEDESK